MPVAQSPLLVRASTRFEAGGGGGGGGDAPETTSTPKTPLATVSSSLGAANSTPGRGRLAPHLWPAQQQQLQVRFPNLGVATPLWGRDPRGNRPSFGRGYRFFSLISFPNSGVTTPVWGRDPRISFRGDHPSYEGGYRFSFFFLTDIVRCFR